MKGLMIQEDLTIEDALKVMEEGQRAPDRRAPMLPPKILGTLFTIVCSQANYIVLALAMPCYYTRYMYAIPHILVLV